MTTITIYQVMYSNGNSVELSPFIENYTTPSKYTTRMLSLQNYFNNKELCFVKGLTITTDVSSDMCSISTIQSFYRAPKARRELNVPQKEAQC